MNKLYTHLSIFIFAFIQYLFIGQVNAQNCWSALGSGVGADSYYDGIETLTTYNGNLIAAGHFSNVGGMPALNIAQWDGTSWSALGSGLKMRTGLNNGYEGFISALAVYNNELYAAGSFDTAGGLPASGIAKWNGTSWSAVGSGLLAFFNGQFGSIDANINTMIVYNGNLYAGGSFDTIGGIKVNNIAKWDGTSWSLVADGVGTGQYRTDVSVSCLCVFNGVLYAGGGFNNASEVPAINIAAWNGNAWTALGSGLGNDTAGMGGVSSIAVYNNQLYAAVAGSDPNQGYAQIYYISKWSGSSWLPVEGGPGTGISNFGLITSMLPFNGNLVVAGEYQVIGADSTASGVTQWDGTSWSDLIGHRDTFFYFKLANYNDRLYVGGLFSGLGATAALNVAEYTCATSVNGIDQILPNYSVSVYPNPTTNVLNISVNNLHGTATAQIYNLLGQLVFQSNLNTDKTEIKLTNQASGTYLYRVSDANGGYVGSGTFVVQ